VQRRVVAFGAFVPKQQRAYIRNKKALQRTAPQRTEQRSAVQCRAQSPKRSALPVLAGSTLAWKA
jgi:hypothetical protein